MFAPKEYRVNKMLDYLEDKYGEKFVEEYFEPGGMIYPGKSEGDSMMVYPEKNKELPFNVHKNMKKSGYNDNYVSASLSYQFTEKYKSGVEKLDNREKAIKFFFALSNRPHDPSTINTPIDDFAKDMSYEGEIELFVAVSAESDQDYKKDAKFLRDLYSYMLKITNRNFLISVAYVQKNKFQPAKDLIRISHTTNFAWTWMGDGFMRDITFKGDRTVQNIGYFEDMVGR
ncbi:hypothetical protein NV379_19035 [Paenibacillus sp. N1-5-1-14]|uniref:hypothetical protein n=1 Tax=Paenibacillus radicibacter TaxID=2972488 RepID=UPI002158E1B9|nr:hypothetical protein [Paenibacillus radicibacter]MCR8643647.1 hypothetical protein [Paenibacillus radicibacter]MCR8644753.1 hypothetical protein [Paenibacillus radicibacter]